MLLQHELQIRVRYKETDAMGLLHHANYFVYFELGRTELLRANGVSIVGTDIPGRHFFMHPRHTQGMLLEYTDDELPGDPRRGTPDPGGKGALPVRSVAWVTAVVDDLDAAVECLRYTFAGEVVGEQPGGDGTDASVDVRIGDMTVRLVVPSSELRS